MLVEGENLELQGVGGEIENKAGASGGKVVGWLGRTSRGNAWVNMWVNTESAGLYDIEIRYLSGANDTLFYVNNDESISGSVDCPLTLPNFGTKTFRVSLKNGLDKIKFYNNERSTINIDSIKITKVEITVDKSQLNKSIEDANKIDTSKYTANSLEEFNEALLNANRIVSKEDATQEEVDKATLEIASAIDNLVEINNDKIDDDKIDDDKTDGNAGNDKNNSGKGNTDKLPNTGAVIGGLSSMVAIALTTIGAVLFKKKED